MKVSYEYDQDPRYGWASIDVGENKNSLIVVHSTEHGSLGFEFIDGEMVPTCICHAYYKEECSCGIYPWDDATD